MVFMIELRTKICITYENAVLTCSKSYVISDIIVCRFDSTVRLQKTPDNELEE
jgi:hypothetical protein